MERMCSPRVKALYAYWLGKRGERRMPSRDDIDPAEIKDLLPYVILTDVHHDPLRVQFRLAGTAVTEAAGRDLTGKWMHAVPRDGGLEGWKASYLRLTRQCAPVFGRTRATVRPGIERTFEWIMLPLSSDGVTVDKTLELEDWEALRNMTEEQIEHASWNTEVFK